MRRVARTTGVTGELLLSKGHVVHGVKRRASLFNAERIDHLFQPEQIRNHRFILHYGDMIDFSSLVDIVQKTRPDEVYRLAAQDHVAVSFEEPKYTADSGGIGALRVLEAIRTPDLARKMRYYQVSTSELFGKVAETPQRATTASVRARPACSEPYRRFPRYHCG